MTTAILPAMGVLFFVIGNFMSKIRPNWFCGVRTPWTLADENVWIQTHRLAAWVFVIVGLAGLVAVMVNVSPVICFVILMAGALLPAVYSLVLYKRLQREGRV